MKNNFVLFLALLITLTGYSQKKELREAAKQIKQGSFAQAKAVLQTIEGSINSADESLQAEYYFYKGQAYAGSSRLSKDDILKATEAFKKAKSFGSKAPSQIDDEIYNLRVKIINSAVADQNAKKHQDASDKLYAGYTMSPADTSDLYFAAINSTQAQNYDQAVRYFEQLLEMNYEGSEITYTAVNVESGQEEPFPSKPERDLALKTGMYIKPAEKVSSSRKADVISALGIIYIDQGRVEEAKALIAEARKTNPDDAALIQAEANIALQNNDMKRYGELMQEIVASDPDNPELYFNLGVSSTKIKDYDNAEKYYKKSLELNPDYYNSNINYALLLIEKGDALIEEMNGLGMSAADNKRYEELQGQLHDIYRQSIPYFQKAIQIRPDDVELMRTIMNIYSILGNDAEAQKWKSKIDSSN